MLSIVSCAFWPPVCLLWRSVYLDLLPIFLIGLFFFLVLSCMSCLYILEINLLLVASFANIFLQSVSCSLVSYVESCSLPGPHRHACLQIFIFTSGFVGAKTLPPSQRASQQEAAGEKVRGQRDPGVQTGEVRTQARQLCPGASNRVH